MVTGLWDAQVILELNLILNKRTANLIKHKN
jgi:hypothetical protein